MAIYKPQHSKNYHYRFKVKGKIVTGSTYTGNRVNAVRYEQKQKEEVYARIYLEQNDNEHITVEEAIKTYMKDNEHAGLTKNYFIFERKMLGKKTNKGTKKEEKCFGLNKKTLLNEIRERDMQALITARRSEGNSASTILYELVYFNQVIKHAKRLGFRVPHIDFSELKKANKLRPQRGQVRYLSPEEESKLIYELCRTSDEGGHLTNVFRLDTMHFTVMLLDMGCRYNELAKLKFESIDMESRCIRLWRPKVKNESILMMTDRVFEILTDRLKVRADDQIYVFEGKFGGARNYAPKAFKAACERAGLVGISYHKLRHTFASKLVQQGVSLYIVQQLLGHTSSATTEIYAHLAPSVAAQEAASVLNKLNKVNEGVMA